MIPNFFTSFFGNYKSSFKSPVDDLLDKEDVTLEEILNESDTINELRLNNSRLIQL